jgi:predicted amidohydrolase
VNSSNKTVRVAAIQAAPVYLDREATLDKAATLLAQAARDGAQLVVFPETWLPGYPAWLDCCRDAALWDHDPVKQVFGRLRDNSVIVPGPGTDRLGKMAREHGVVLNITVNERVDAGAGRGTLYNSQLTFDADGRLVIHHRKIMPTYTERMVWGMGDAAGLHAADTAVGRVGGLICWEHWMPLARQAMHVDGEDVHIAAWPQVKEMNLVASRHYAFEGRCFVIACGGILYGRDLPPGLDPLPKVKSPDALVLRGGSAIIAPDGKVLAGPVFDQETILTADLDLSQIGRESMALDVTGHYSRPDLFSFAVRQT